VNRLWPHWADRGVKLAVDICALGVVLSLIASLSLLAMLYSLGSNALELDGAAWLFSLPTALALLALSLALLCLCVWLDRIAYRPSSNKGVAQRNGSGPRATLDGR
jgi:hypothetical protein